MVKFSKDKIRVGVLRGGPSSEYDVSLSNGGTILRNIPDGYEPVDIFISKSGVWHESGIEKLPYNILNKIDVALVAMRGFYGEDGKVQKILEDMRVPYVGSGSISSAVSVNKNLSKNVLKSVGIKTPVALYINTEEVNSDFGKVYEKIWNSLPFPLVVKPATGGSSIGVSLVMSKADIMHALNEALKYSDSVVVEEYIEGREASVGVVEGFRNTPLYSLIPVEIIKNNRYSIRTFEDKRKENPLKYRVPGYFSETESEELKALSILAHKSLGLRHFSKSDFIVNPRRGIYCLEVNALPAISEGTSFSESLKAVGSSTKDFISHILSQVIKK